MEVIKSLVVKLYYSIFGKKNIVFIWIPKTGGTSIFRILEHYNGRKYLDIDDLSENFGNRGITTFGHISYADLIQANFINDAFHQNSYKFTFVRNPYDRLVSLYSYFKKMNRIPQNLSFAGFCEKATNPDNIGLHNVKGFSQCNPQITWLNKVNVDFIGKFENLSVDIKKLLKNLGMYRHHHLPHKNRSNHKHYLDYYDNSTLALINEFYLEDFKKFNYEIYESTKDFSEI